MSDTIRWGILGTGQVAHLFAQGLRALPEARLVAVGSRSLESARVFALAHGAPRACRYEDVVRDSDVDAVYVATPASLHLEHALLALEHRKPVLCEKPFTVDASQAHALVQAARARGVFLMEAMWMRFVPVLREVEALLDSGALGEVRMLSASLGLPLVFNPSHRVFDASLGGGALLDVGVYPLSLAVRLLGRPSRVSSHAVRGPTGVDEQCTVLLDFPDGPQACLTASLRHATSDDALLMGSEGLLRLHAPLYCPQTLSLVPTPRLETGASRTRALPGRLGLEVERLKRHPLLRAVREGVRRARAHRVSRPVLGNGYSHEAAEVARCLRLGLRESPLMTLEDSLIVMETVDAARRCWAGAESPLESRRGA